jgi:SAM-dependent methyltransferase
MYCLSQMVSYFTHALEQFGLYEPEISIHEARYRLSLEGEKWKNCQEDRDAIWNNFQEDNDTNGKLPSLVKKAIIHLQSRDIHKGVAVDLGCGISKTTFHLLERGWRVYAVDSSKNIIFNLANKVFNNRKKWIENGQLVLINQSIEEFKYPEKVDLITATDSFPYCDPNEINNIFLKAKNALNPQGVLVCSLFPYSDIQMANNLLREIFGGWMTTRNVIEAVLKSVDFPSWSLVECQNPSGLSKQFHVCAYK